MTAVAPVADIVAEATAIVRAAERSVRRRRSVMRALSSMCQFGFVIDAGVASVLLADHSYLSSRPAATHPSTATTEEETL